jgi:serine/threonine-protein kinase
MANGATRPAIPAAVADANAAGSGQDRPKGDGASFVRPSQDSEDKLESAATVPPSEPPTSVRLPAGTMISDRYRITRVLGEGGMGVVYAAEHILMRKEVAVKVLHAEMCSVPEVVARFEREAIAAAHVDHPNVAGATDFGRLEDGSCYLVLELLKGPSLRDEIAKGPLPLVRALHILRGMAAGVAAAHAKGIVHRDLKPENVMLIEKDGTPDFVKVLDFGIAKVDPTVASAPKSVGKLVTAVGTVFGTPEYMAPEQAVGDTVDGRADLYALGVIFLEMITGKCPFQGKPLSILRERILSAGPPDMSNVSDPDARALVSKLLTRQPDDRMQSANELIAAIDAIVAERKPASMPPPPALPPAAPEPSSAEGGSRPSATTNPVIADATAPVVSPRSKRWIMIPIGVVAALVVFFGMFAVVKAVTAPKADATAPVTAANTVELPVDLPPPSETTPAPSSSASTAPPVESESAPPAPAATPAKAQAAPTTTARSTPKTKPATRPSPGKRSPGQKKGK